MPTQGILGFPSHNTLGRFSSRVSIPGTMVLRDRLTVPPLTADVNNWQIKNLGTASIVRISGTAARNITGLADGVDGDVKMIENVGSYPLTLVHASASSDAKNRFSLPNGINAFLPPGAMMMLNYDGASKTWRALTGASTPATLEALQANRYYFVRADGNDANTGLVNSSAGAFLTIQRAINVTKGINLNGFDVVIYVIDGTYDGNVDLSGPFVGWGPGVVHLYGNPSTPANCVIGGYISLTDGAKLMVQGFTIGSSGGYCLKVDGFGTFLRIAGNMRFVSPCWEHFRATSGAWIDIWSSYTIAGTANNQHYLAYDGGTIRCEVWVTNTVTVSGTPTINTFAWAHHNGSIEIHGTTFSGGANGQRFAIDSGGHISVKAGAGLTYFPGSTAGVNNGGTYEDGTTYVQGVPSGGVINFGNGLARIVHDSGTDSIQFLDATYKFAGTVQPNSDGGSNLGAAGAAWYTIHLIDEGIINWANGAATIDRDDATDLLKFTGTNVGVEGYVAPLSDGSGGLGTTTNKWPILRLTSGGGVHWGPDSGKATLDCGSGGFTWGWPNYGNCDLYWRTANTGSAGFYFTFNMDAPSAANDDLIFAQEGRSLDSTQNSANWLNYGSIAVNAWDVSNGGEDGLLQLGAVAAGGWQTGIGVNNGVRIGNPTGSFLGYGTLNASAVYDDNSLLTCMALSQEFLDTGTIDVVAWDAKAPEFHYGARLFKDMLDAGFDPRDPVQYCAKVLADHALPGMPTEQEWVQNSIPLSGLINRLWLAVEMLALVVLDHQTKLKAGGS